MKEDESTIFEFRLQTITVNRFAYSEQDSGPIPAEKVRLLFQWNATSDIDSRLVGIDCAVQAFPEDQESLPIFLILVHYTFEFFTDEIFMRAGDDVHIPIEVVKKLLDVGYSTTRGILFERLAGTSFAGLPMPVLDSGTLYAAGMTNVPTPNEEPEKKQKPKRRK